MNRLRSRKGRTIIVGLLVLATALVVAWLMRENRIQEPLVTVPGGDPTIGRSEIAANACLACHSIPGVPGAESSIGPPLDNWAERHFVAGSQPNEPQVLIAFLVDPQSVRPGTAMPNMDLTEEQATDIAAYLYTLYDDWPVLGGAAQWPLWDSP